MLIHLYYKRNVIASWYQIYDYMKTKLAKWLTRSVMIDVMGTVSATVLVYDAKESVTGGVSYQTQVQIQPQNTQQNTRLVLPPNWLQRLVQLSPLQRMNWQLQVLQQIPQAYQLEWLYLLHVWLSFWFAFYCWLYTLWNKQREVMLNLQKLMRIRVLNLQTMTIYLFMTAFHRTLTVWIVYRNKFEEFACTYCWMKLLLLTQTCCGKVQKSSKNWKVIDFIAKKPSESEGLIVDICNQLFRRQTTAVKALNRFLTLIINSPRRLRQD